MGEELSIGFHLDLPILKAETEKIRGENVRHVSGFASLELRDQQNETVIQKGLDYRPFLDTGYINWDHGDIRRGSPAFLIGEPTMADIRSRNGVPGFYIEGFLYNDKPMANDAWDHLQATGKSMSARKPGWSIQGHTLAAANGQILRSVVRDVALTHKPVLRETTVDYQEIVKSLDNNGLMNVESLMRSMASQPVAGQSYGDLSALRTEDVAAVRINRPKSAQQFQAVMEAIYGPKDNMCKSHFDNDGQFYNGSEGALTHMVSCLGWDVEDALPVVRLLRNAFTYKPINKEGF